MKFYPGQRVLCLRNYDPLSFGIPLQFSKGSIYIVDNLSLASRGKTLWVKEDDMGNKNGWNIKFFIPATKLAMAIYEERE